MGDNRKPRLYGEEISHQLAALILRDDSEGAYQTVHQLLNGWRIQNGLAETLILDLASQYATALLRLHNGDQTKAAEHAERTALDREVENSAAINAAQDLVLPPELEAALRARGLWPITDEETDDETYPTNKRGLGES